MKNRLIVLLILSVLFISCNNNDKLNRALTLSGDNRPEMEKVLAHYSQSPADSLKYKAAVFLIENMPGHYSYVGDSKVDEYYSKVDSILEYKLPYTQFLEKVDSLIKTGYENVSFMVKHDIRNISSTYLIHNIDRAFEAWEKPWAQHLGFDDFCEYILPYRIMDEPLENWRDSVFTFYDKVLDNMQYDDKYRGSAFWACYNLNDTLRNTLSFFNQSIPGPRINKISIIHKMSVGICSDFGALATLLMRSQGVPVMMDMTPLWPFRDFGHAWNIVKTNQKGNIVFGGGDTNPGEPHKIDDKMAKVFRNTYKINDEREKLLYEKEDIPASFKDLFKKDVTSEYLETGDITLPILKDLKRKNKYSYLCLFDNKQWVAVDYAKTKSHKVTFTAMGKDILYLPAYYDNGDLKPFNYPFVFDKKGKVHYFEPDTASLETITIRRKYYTGYDVMKVYRMIGGEVQAANKPDFSDKISLFTIDSVELGFIPRNINTGGKKYRYWRYASPPKSYGNIAEVMFFNDNELINNKGEIIGTSGSFTGNKNSEKYAAFDNNPLTILDAPQENGAWVGLDFGKPVEIDKVVLIPRSDDNDVYPDNEYEVFYWSHNGWVSMGKKVADSFTLEYDNAPKNALFFIRNYTRGTDERIFAYEKGKQIFW